MKKNETPGASCPRADIGGQAVLDGVMMKSPDAIAVAVRRPNGDIVVKREDYEAPSKKHPWMGKPFIRGSVNMVQMLGIGMRVLEDSMKMSGNEEAQEEPSKFEKWLAEKLGKKVDSVVMAVAIVRCVCGETFETGSTKKELRVEICSKCHPFFTGKQKLVDSGGRVDRFKKRFGM